MTSLLIWVAAKNHPARGFYEALGGQLLGEKQEEFFDAPIDEVAYGWKDTGVLFADGGSVQATRSNTSISSID